ncbi:hypothetical protein [Kosakonia sp. BK9b]
MLQLSPIRPRLRAMGQGAWQSGSFFIINLWWQYDFCAHGDIVTFKMQVTWLCQNGALLLSSQKSSAYQALFPAAASGDNHFTVLKLDKKEE